MRSKSQELVDVVERDVAGVTSSGVLLSEAELGVTKEHGGLLCFETWKEHAKFLPGERVDLAIGGVDTILVIDNKSLTHRPDLWSHWGFAREIAAILGRPFKRDMDVFADDRADTDRFQKDQAAKALWAKLQRPEHVKETRFNIAIDRATKCRRFTAIEVDGVGTIAIAASPPAGEPTPGVAAIVYTNIANDGMMQGIDAGTLADLKTFADLGLPTIASGGVTTLDDVRQLAALHRQQPNLVGAIIGRALYEGTISVPAAIAAAT